MLPTEADREPEMTSVNSGSRLRHEIQGMAISLSCIKTNTGTTQRDGMGREEGSGWGAHVYL